MTKPVLYGPSYSTYVRSVRLACEEKNVDYDLVEVDIFAGAHQTPEHLARHPFGKVPAFEHGDLKLFETNAITRYINENFEGVDLEPKNVRARAIMAEIIGVITAYAYPCMITHIFIQRVVMPMMGTAADEAVIEAAIPPAKTCAMTLESLIGSNTYLAGDALTRADLMFIPVYDYLSQTQEGKSILADASSLQAWWERVRTRPSVEKTVPKLG
ncbi:MAG: glutathione S-transferase N-terminal domain-containing protein [Proteobacteria bacterium]|nr:glutathione S-transferase N-terminal domain-containing protein [Pseudomonadota bacterium]